MSTAQNRIEDLFLRPWHEALGKCIQIDTAGKGTTILLESGDKTFRLRLPDIEENLQDLAGKHIAILRTDVPEKPFLVRKVADVTSTATTSETPVRAHKCRWR